MERILPIYKKEMTHYFKSPIAAITITVFLLISGWFFVSSLFGTKLADMRYFLSNIETIILIFFTAAISMRLIAEEKSRGSLELLVTLPVSEIEILLGKFLSALTILAISMALTLPYVITLASLGNIDGGQTFLSYMGFFLIGASYLSIGTLFSTVTRNQIVAFMLSLLVMLLLWLIGFDFVLLYLPARLRGFFQFLSVRYHFDSFAKGVLHTRDVIYFLSLIGFSLTLATRTLVSRKWR
jgi:ABC-2 type transport system permease protein